MTPDLLTRVLTAQTPPSLAPRDWERLLGQARRTSLSGRLALRLQQRGWLESVPAGPAVHLRNALLGIERHRGETLWEIDRILAALSIVDTPVVLLKGAAYLRADLPAARGRIFGDVDILVARPRLDAVEKALAASGWLPEKLDPYDERYYRHWMHELPPLRHVVRGSMLDVHHTITAPTSRFRVDVATLLERAVALSADGRLRVLAPADMVLHSAVHLMQEGEFDHGLRDLLDLDDLLRHFALREGFWLDLLRRARELGLATPLWHALDQVERLFGPQVPESLRGELVRLRPHGPTRPLMRALLAVALRPPHPSSDLACTPLARGLLYVRSHALRMPPHQVVPHLVRKAWMRRFPAAA